jgi:acyl dehydratase
MQPILLDTPQSLGDFVGLEIGVSDWFTVTQDRVSKFAEATEDRQWIHVDRERARRESPFGTTIAHGFLTLAMCPYLIEQVFQIRGGVKMRVNYGLNLVRFPAPVPADSQIRGRITLQSLKEYSGFLEAVFLISVEGRETPKPCCVVEYVTRFYS